MVEWWKRANQLLIDERVHVDMLPDMVIGPRSAIIDILTRIWQVEKSFVLWREFVSETLKLADQHGIPFLVFSAGLAELIEQVIRHLEGR